MTVASCGGCRGSGVDELTHMRLHCLPCNGSGEVVTCDAEGCATVAACLVKRNRDGMPIKKWLPEGWGTVQVLDGDQQFCPFHAERLL